MVASCNKPCYTQDRTIEGDVKGLEWVQYREGYAWTEAEVKERLERVMLRAVDEVWAPPPSPYCGPGRSQVGALRSGRRGSMPRAEC